MDPRRRIFSNRTLNLRAIKAVGYDMDYTLIHYVVDVWERHAYDHVKRVLADRGLPVDGLEFDPDLMIRGLVIDAELGNVVKANRFGYVKRAFHGSTPLPYEALRQAYSRTVVDLTDARFSFMNTLFSLSEACMFAQLVDRLDAGRFGRPFGYRDLYREVRNALDHAHMEGRLKEEIMAAPERFVVPDPETPTALLDQKHAGKKLLLITNSGFTYTDHMMRSAFEPHLPGGMKWRDLFDLVIVGADKPAFFTGTRPILEVVTEDGLLKPAGALGEGRAFHGACADAVEQCLGLQGDEILYVGDHIFSDVHVSHRIQRWRTALVLRELEREVEAIQSFGEQQALLTKLMGDKESLEAEYCQLRLTMSRIEHHRSQASAEATTRRMSELRAALTKLDAEIGPMAVASSRLCSENWGLLLRTGNDKSHLARQIERYADIYLSRVSNFGLATPYAYLRSARGSLPHD